MREPINARSPAEVMEAMVAAFNTGQVDDVRDYVDATYLDHQGLRRIRPIEGPDGFRLVVETARSGYSKLSVEVVDLIEGEDRTAARLVWSGVSQSGHGTRRETLEIVRVVSGRAVEHWGGHS